MGRLLSSGSLILRGFPYAFPLLRLTLLFWSAQLGCALQNDAEQKFRVQSNLVQFNVVFTDKRGKSVSDIKPEEVSVLDDGRPQKIAIFEAPQKDVVTASTPSTGIRNSYPITDPARPDAHVIIAIPGLDFASRTYVDKAISNWLNELQGSASLYIAVVDASGAVQPFTNSLKETREFVAHDLKLLTPGYEKSSFVRSALNLLSQMKSMIGPKTLVVFDDFYHAENPVMGSTRARVFLPEALDCGASIYVADPRGVSPVVPFGDATTSEDALFSAGFSAHPGPQVQAQIVGQTWAFGQQQRALSDLADVTGGYFEGGNDTSRLFSKLSSDIHNTYVLGYYLAGLGNDGRFHRITVVSRRGVHARAKQGYFAPLPWKREEATPTELETLLSADRPFSDIRIAARPEIFFRQRDRKPTGFVDVDFRWHPPAGSDRAVLDFLGRLWNLRNGEEVASLHDVRTITTEELRNADGEHFSDLHRRIELPLRPGEYVLKIAAVTSDGQRGTGTGTLTIPDQHSGIALSSIVLGRLVNDKLVRELGGVRADTYDPLALGDQEIIPAIVHEFNMNQSFVLFARAVPQSLTAQIEAKVRIRNIQGRTMLEPSPVLVSSDQGSAGYPVMFEINPIRNGLTPGRFIAELEVKDVHSGQIAKAESNFILVGEKSQP